MRNLILVLLFMSSSALADCYDDHSQAWDECFGGEWMVDGVDLPDFMTHPDSLFGFYFDGRDSFRMIVDEMDRDEMQADFFDEALNTVIGRKPDATSVTSIQTKTCHVQVCSSIAVIEAVAYNYLVNHGWSSEEVLVKVMVGGVATSYYYNFSGSLITEISFSATGAGTAGTGKFEVTLQLAGDVKFTPVPEGYTRVYGHKITDSTPYLDNKQIADTVIVLKANSAPAILNPPPPPPPGRFVRH